MSHPEKDVRKDIRGRPLLEGEEQLPDGSYSFSLTDKWGHVHTIKSSYLCDEDIPIKARNAKSLRAKEALLRNTKFDKLGRTLNPGETQLQDGHYRFRYLASPGKHADVYSWTLLPTDATPPGKAQGPCLREREAQIAIDKTNGVNTAAGRMLTLNDIFNKYITSKLGLKESTRDNYTYMYNLYVRDSLGQRPIGQIVHSDIRSFFSFLIKERNFKPRSTETIFNVIRPAFELAIKDGLLAKNPADGVLEDLRKSANWKKNTRTALTAKEQQVFMDFAKNSNEFKHWVPLFTFLFGTGVRVGEAIGLCLQDCSFSENVIHIHRNLLYRRHSDGHNRLTISSTKTAAGNRTIPMFSAVRQVLLDIKEAEDTGQRPKSPVVDGVSGFVFRNRDGGVLLPQSINRAIKRIVYAFNATEKVNAESENREAFVLRDFSAHILRKSFCTRFYEVNQNLKVLQQISGHSDLETLMKCYTFASEESKKEVVESIDDKIQID